MAKTIQDRVVLVTGGSGFVGGAIARYLAGRGFTVRLAVRNVAHFDGAAEFSGVFPIGDLAGPVDWGRAVDGADAVVHAAGCASPPRGMSESTLFKINAAATGDLARAAHGAGVRTFIPISSVRAVCGATSSQSVDGRFPPAPTDAYGRSKLAAEQAAQAVGVPVVALRPVIVHGAGAGANMAALAKLAASRLPLPFAGLAGKRSIVSDVNLADAVSFVLQSGAAMPEAMMVADAEPLTVGGICAAMRASRGRRAGLVRIPESLMRAAAGIAGQSERWERLAGSLVVSCAELEALGWIRPEPSAAGLGRMMMQFQ